MSRLTWAGASLRMLSAAISDLAVVADVGLEAAALQAETDANRFVFNEVAKQGPRALLRLASERPLQLRYSTHEDLEYLQHYLSQWEFLSDPESELPSRVRRSIAASSLLIPSLGGFGPSPLAELVNAVVAHETAQRLPDEGYAIRSLSYTNPISMELVAAIGPAAAGIGYLLSVLRTWSSRRHVETARASAEDRMLRANQRDLEDLVKRKIQLRNLMLDGIANGELSISPKAIDSLLTMDLAKAADRLSDQSLSFAREESADADDDA